MWLGLSSGSANRDLSHQPLNARDLRRSLQDFGLVSGNCLTQPSPGT